MKPGWTLEFLAGYVAGLRAAADMDLTRADRERILARAQELDPK
jgi:hypothetical protein